MVNRFPMNTVIQAPIGIIGGGFGGLMTYIMLRFRGVPAHDIRIFTTDTSPEQSWARFVRAINQKTLRSESVAHFYPTDSPGLATVEAFKMWSLKPIIQSWFDLYHPTVEFMINHIQTMTAQTRFFSSIVPVTITSVRKTETGFNLFSGGGELTGQVQHVVLAVGHGVPSMPMVIERFQTKYPDDKRVRHTFTGMAGAPVRATTTLVLGSGLTSGTQWANILGQGGRVIAVCPEGFNMGQPLNTPRKYFSSRGIAPFTTQVPADRARELKMAMRGTIPAYPEWMRLFDTALRDGRLILIQGCLEDIMPTQTSEFDSSLSRSQTGLTCFVRETAGHSLFSFTVDSVVAAAGFKPVTTHPLIADLVATYNLPTHQNFLEVTPDFTIPALSSPASTAFVIGAAAVWAIPSGDSIGGMKITAHTIADRLCGAESWRPSELWAKTVRWYKLTFGQTI